MKRMILAGFGALLVTAVSTFAVLTVLNVDVLDIGTAQEEVAPPGGPAGSILLWSTREKLAICIDVGGEASLRADASELRVLSTEAVTDAMADVVEHPVYQGSASVSGVEVIVDPDCPGQAKMQCPEDPERPAIGCVSSLVTEPSPYRLFVFVVSEADLQRVTGGLTERLAAIEHVCTGDFCDVVTSVTWVSEKEAADRGALYELLAEGLGLIEPRGD